MTLIFEAVCVHCRKINPLINGNITPQDEDRPTFELEGEHLVGCGNCKGKFFLICVRSETDRDRKVKEKLVAESKAVKIEVT